MKQRRGFRGAIVWALVPFQPQAPFELDDRSYATAKDAARAIREGALSRVPVIRVEAKLRPIAILQERPRGVRPEYAALKLARTDKYPEADRQRVRRGKSPSLVALSNACGLRHENAIDLTSLVRVHRSAFATAPIGHLTTDEMEVVGRRLAAYLDIDLEAAIADGVAKRWAKLVAAQRQR